MPQYLLSVWHDDEYEVDVTSDAVQRLVAQVGAFNDDLAAAGAMVFAAGLMPASTASVLRLVDGKVDETDGPYASTRPQMGGFWVIEAADVDAARDWARRAAAACEDAVELRPFQAE